MHGPQSTAGRWRKRIRKILISRVPIPRAGRQGESTSDSRSIPGTLLFSTMFECSCGSDAYGLDKGTNGRRRCNAAAPVFRARGARSALDINAGAALRCVALTETVVDSGDDVRAERQERGFRALPAWLVPFEGLFSFRQVALREIHFIHILGFTRRTLPLVTLLLHLSRASCIAEGGRALPFESLRGCSP